jgi:hypothetical protein
MKLLSNIEAHGEGGGGGETEGRGVFLKNMLIKMHKKKTQK